MSRSPAEPGPSPRLGPKLVCCIGLLLAVAGGFALPEGAVVENWAVRIWVPLPDLLVIAAVASFSIACLIVIAMTRPWRQIHRQEDDELEKEEEPPPAWMAALLFLLSLTQAAMLIAAIFWLAQSDFLGVLGFGRMTTGDPATAVAVSDAPWAPASPVTTGLIGALVLLAGFGSLAFVLWMFFGKRLGRLPGNFAHPHGPLAAAVEDSLDDLRREPDPRTAIIRIYGNFERALAGASLPRRAWETPIEFMRVVLMRLPLPAAAVRSLTEVFELARFSRHPIGAAERDSAWRSLIEIRGALDKERKASDAGAP
jgi:hypothetical protein